MFTKDKLSLFFSMPLNTQDWNNLTYSKVTGVMMPYNPQIADNTTLKEFGKRNLKVVLRLTPDDLDKLSLGEVQARMFEVKELCSLRAIIVGNEPDDKFVHRYDSTDWGVDYCYNTHLPQLDKFRRTLQGHGVSILSPGWLQRNFTEGSPPEPGIVAWSRAAQPVYNEMDGNCIHIYGYGWHGLPAGFGEWPVDYMRFMNQIRFWEMLWHKPIWIDESNIDKGPEPEDAIPGPIRMRACMGMARTLRDNPIIGARVEFYCPFVSNGYGNHYPQGMVMNQPEAYEEVRTFMME